MDLFKDFKKVSHQDWLDKITIDLKGRDYSETLVWKSEEGIDVQPFYNTCPDNLNTTSFNKKNTWKISERIGINSIKDANRQALLALKGGASSLVFFGVLNNQTDMDDLLQSIDTSIISIHFYNSKPLQTSKFVSFNSGSVSYDFLGDCLEANNWDKHESNLGEIEALVTSENYKSITVNASKYLENNFTTIQEIGFSLSQGVEYLNMLTEKNIDASLVASKMQFTFGIGSNYFFEIAKIRAFRKLWELVLIGYNVSDTYTTIHSETKISSQNESDKNYNILRNTTKAMSAVIGGCDYLAILPHDKEKTNLQFSKRIARNIQHILKEEAFFDKVINPADGAYYIEHLTDKIASEAWGLFQEVENQGGFLFCSQNKLIQK